MKGLNKLYQKYKLLILNGLKSQIKVYPTDTKLINSDISTPPYLSF